MRVFIIVLVLIFSFQSWTKADDIRDFEIEGISIGNSLLDYFSEEKIEEEKKSEYVYKYKDNRFMILGIGPGSAFPLTKKLEIYQELGVTIKPNDKNYKIYSIDGEIYCKKINECKDISAKITPELIDFFGEQAKLNTWKDPHELDKTGNSIAYGNTFHFKKHKDTVSVTVYEWSEEIKKTKGWEHSVKVSVALEEFENFLKYEAYK